MSRVSSLAIAFTLIVTMASAASAQVKVRSGAAQSTQRAQSAPNLVSDPYGERPRSPGADPCSQRPFALGCDKRGFW